MKARISTVLIIQSVIAMYSLIFCSCGILVVSLALEVCGRGIVEE